MNLFFAKIHLGNFLYAYVKSWSCRIHYASTTVPNGWLKRFHAVHFVDAFSYDEWVQFRDEIWAEWASIVAGIPPADWSVRLFNHRVNFHRVALQHLSRDYLAHRRMIRYIERLGVAYASISDSMALRYLRSLSPTPCFDADSKIGIARGGWLWDVAYLWVLNIGWALYLFLQALSALRARLGPSTIDVLHDGLSHSESGAGPYELSFSWLQDRGICSPDQILYVVGFSPKHRAANIMQRRGLLGGLGWRTALRAVWHGTAMLMRGLRHRARLHEVLVVAFELRVVVPYLSAAGRNIRIYLTTLTASFPEHPCVAVFNAMGIRTVIWAYSANFSLFNQRYLCAERNIHTAHMETSECWVWSEHHLALWRRGEISPPRRKFRLLGPAMMADASPCLLTSPECRRRYLGLGDNGSGFRTIAVFDISPRTKEGLQVKQLGPWIMTEELVDAFYRHLILLLDAFPEVRLLVKTKRRDIPGRAKPPAQKRLVDPAGQWVRDGRVIDLDPEINPYIPIGAADLTIGIPFTSPVIAGLHFGRCGLFHDPLGNVLQHHYHDLDDLISHGYEDLERKVRYWLYECPAGAFEGFLDRAEIRRFLGPRPGADPAEEFGKALWGEGFTLSPSSGNGLNEKSAGEPDWRLAGQRQEAPSRYASR